MTDNVTIDNGGLSDFETSTDYATSGHIQRVKLTYSADGSDTHVPADADGLLVNTGASVTTTGGTLEGLAAALIDSAGEQVTLSKPIVISQTPTLDTSAYAAGDSMWGTSPIEFADAVATNGGTGHIIKLAVYDDSDNGTAGDFKLWLFKSSQNAQAANSAWSLTDALMDEVVAVIDTAGGTWYDAINGQVCFVYPSPPLPIDCDATSLYAHGVVDSGRTPTFAADSLEIKLHILRD